MSERKPPKRYGRLTRVPKACKESSALLEAILASCLLTRKAFHAEMDRIIPVSERMIYQWLGGKEHTTIAPRYYPALVEVLELTDEELEALMICTLQEWDPYWTDDGRDTPYDECFTGAQIAEEMDCTRQNISLIELEAIAHMAEKLVDK